MAGLTTIFDLDGTLGDHEAAVVHAARVFYARHAAELGMGFEESLASWREASARYPTGHTVDPARDQRQRRERMRAVFSANLSDAEADARFGVYYAAYREGWKLYPEALACLERRRKLGPLGLITNGSSLSQRGKLEKTGIAHGFDFIVVSGEVGWNKPDARIFEHALSLQANERRDCLFVGDSLPHDIAGAAGVGLPAVWIDRSGTKSGPAGVRRINRLDEL